MTRSYVSTFPLRRALATFVATVVLSSGVQAETVGALKTLKGVVQAEDGAVLPGVAVIVEALGAVASESTKWKTVADDQGRFEIAGLAPGRYSLMLVRGVGGIGDTLRRTIDIRNLGKEALTEVLLVVWKSEASAAATNLGKELRYGVMSAPRDGLRDLPALPPSDIDDLEPVVEESLAAVAGRFDPRGDIRVAQSVSLGNSGATRGLDAGFSFDSALWETGSVNVAGHHLRGGSLTSPMLTGSRVGGEGLLIGVDVAASDIDRLHFQSSMGRDFLDDAAGRELHSEGTVSDFDGLWQRRTSEGDLAVRVSYARGTLSLSGLPFEDIVDVQSFWGAHGNYVVTSLEDHQISVGGAFRRDRAPSSLAAWPGAYDDVAGLVAFTNNNGAAEVYVRDLWRISQALSAHYGIAAFYPLSNGDRSFVQSEAGVDLRLWQGGELTVNASYIDSPDTGPSGDAMISDGVIADEGYVAVLAELEQELEDGARISAFAGTRDLRTLYLQATAGEPDADLPAPLFYTTGYAQAKELGVRLASAPMGQGGANITFSYLRGRTDGALTVQPYEYLQQSLRLGRTTVAPARVGYSQALVAIAVPRAGTAFDISYVTVNARDTVHSDAHRTYSLWGGQVRQDLPFLDFKDARFAVLVAANQVLQELYRLEAIAQENPRQIQISGGIGLRF